MADDSLRGDLYAGLLSAAMKAGTEFAWLRSVVESIENQGFDVEEMYAAERARAQKLRGVEVPSLAELRSTEEGILGPVGSPDWVLAEMQREVRAGERNQEKEEQEDRRHGDGELSEDEIRHIAHDYIRQTVDAPGRIRKIVRGDQLTGRKPMVYMGPDWDRQWVVYFERDHPSGSFVIGPSTIMAIDRETGEVTYYGSANDEG